MGPLYAFSASNFVKTVGSYVGFASIVGLALLVLLYFAHARENASLRKGLAEADGRIADLEQRLEGVARGSAAAVAPGPSAAPSRSPAPVIQAAGSPGHSPAPAPASAAGAAASAAAGGVVIGAVAASVSGSPSRRAGGSALQMSSVPAAPAGVGAPALAAATRLIPAAPSRRNGSAHGPAATPAPAPAPSSAPGPAAGSPSPAPTPGSATAPVRAPTRDAAPRPRPSLPPRPTIGSAAGSSRASSGVTPEPGRRRPPGRFRARSLLALAIGALVLAGVVVLLLVLTSGGGSTQTIAAHPTAPTTSTPAPQPRPHTTTVNRAALTVAVLNGTAVGGVAHTVSTKLIGAGYKAGKVSNASDQTRTATVVAYLPGQRAGALAVATSLGLGSASVQAVDSATRQIVCGSVTPCAESVVVTVGTDLKSR